MDIGAEVSNVCVITPPLSRWETARLEEKGIGQYPGIKVQGLAHTALPYFDAEL